MMYRRLSRSFSTRDSGLSKQLEFCCLVNGWEIPCITCPFRWFDMKNKQYHYRNPIFHDTKAEVALAHLGITSNIQTVHRRQIKEAFRRQALEWHPDCNKQHNAEAQFREILDSYQYLLAIIK